MNPRFSIRSILAEPLENAGIAKAEHEAKIIAALELVRLPQPAQYLDRYPHQLSGGQLQRVVMARALILQPEFVVADEPVSMLDVSVRAGVLNVFRDVRDRLGLTAIYISHDLALVRYVCERTIVMYLGKVMEDGPTEDIVQQPLHPYTKALVAAVPVPHPDQSHDPLPIGRGAPDPRNPPSGCVFRDRCPLRLRPLRDRGPSTPRCRRPQSRLPSVLNPRRYRCSPPPTPRPGLPPKCSAVGEQPDPVAGPGEVLVRVRASGINPADVKRRAGWNGMQMEHPLVIPHTDGAGEIVDVGQGVERARIGERVWLWNAQGGYGTAGRAFGTAAGLIAIDAGQAVRLPDEMTFAAGACLGVPAMTAFRAVHADGPVERPDHSRQRRGRRGRALRRADRGCRRRAGDRHGRHMKLRPRMPWQPAPSPRSTASARMSWRASWS